jgi:drug/metabolite transporter (DMT)-like permease
MAPQQMEEETMNKAFVWSVVAVFVTAMLLGFVVHGVLLHKDYERLVPNLFRGEADAQAHFVYMLLAHVIMAIGVTWVYRMGRENKPWLAQGIRFGIAIALLSTIPLYLIYFAVQPLPSDLVAQQIVYDTIAMVILGIVTAAVNRDPVPMRV